MRKKVNKKLIVALLSFVLLFGGTFGSSLAWLLDNSDPVTNTFSTSDITVNLEESPATYQMVPGMTIDKDPKATVTADSVDCYMFVEITSKNAEIEGSAEENIYDLGKYIHYSIDSMWTPVKNTTNVFYIKVDGTSAKKGTPYNVLGAGKLTIDGHEYSWDDNQVLTKPSLTKDDMTPIDGYKIENGVKVADASEEALRPQLIFKAYATQLQKDNDTPFSPEEAWAIAKPTNP